MKKSIFSSLLLLAFIASFATITGNAFLEDQTDHSDIKIKFIPQSPSAQLDSTYTAASGFYSIDIQGGVYTIEFSKQDYLTQFYNQGDYITLNGNEVLSAITLISSVGNSMAGSISGVWTNEFTYYIIDDVFVELEDTLIIEEGTVIKIHNNCSFNIFGLLQANGTESSPVFFTADDDPPFGAWGNLAFNYNSSPSSFLNHCIIEYSNEIYINSDIVIENCEIQNSNYGIYFTYSQALVNNNKFQYCTGSAVEFHNCNGLTFTNNEIWSNQLNYEFKGIYLWASQGIIENNIFHGNNNSNWDDYAIYVDNYYGPQQLDISNNIMYEYNYGIYCIENDHISIINNVIYSNSENGITIPNGNALVQSNCITNNGIGIHEQGINTNIDISYNLVWNNLTDFSSNIPGIGQIVVNNSNNNPCDPYFNLIMDPGFIDPENFDFHIYYDSPAIDAGNNDNVISAFDFEGNDRILDGNNDEIAIVDLGVHEVPVEFLPNSNFSSPEFSCVDDIAFIVYTGNALINSSYYWDFDGGTILSGEGQGPYEIMWTETGNKVISLYVQSGENTSDTTYQNIAIESLPGEASIPAGPTELCQGSEGIEYSTTSIENAEEYLWELLPSGAAGNLINNDTSVLIDWSPFFSGDVYLKVTGVNSCGEGTTSEMLAIEIISAVTVFINIEASSNPVCAGEPVTFTASPENGGDNPVYQWMLNGGNAGNNEAVYSNSNPSNNDAVFCTLLSSMMCAPPNPSESNVISMEVNETPEVIILALPNDTACIDQIVVLDAGNSGSIFLWSTGETTQQISVNNTSGPSGGWQTYSVNIFDENECAGSDEISVYFDPCTGIPAHSSKQEIEIYPNPTFDIVSIGLPDAYKNGTIELYSDLGKLLLSVSIKNELEMELNLSEFDTGIYFFKISSNHQVETIKIIRK